MNTTKLATAVIGGAMLIAASTLAVFAQTTSPTVSKGPVATAPGQNKLQCFDGPGDATNYGGDCNMKSNGAKGPATLSINSNDPDGDYAGVYVMNTNLSGQALSDVKMLGYNYKGSTTPTPGALSLNVPLDLDNSGGPADAYAFIDAYYCPGTNGHVDVINDSNCGIWVNDTQYNNWADLTAAYSDATISIGALPFVIAERTPSENGSTWTVTNVTLGKPGK